jgi:tRNA1(Val) A37 N6-methylase TrmN6
MSAAELAEQPERTVDAFLGGRVTLIQPRKGHRAGLDAALLQALVPADATGHAIDLGAGVGSVAFSVAARVPAIKVTGIERDPDLVACGVEALALVQNAAFSKRVLVIAGDAGAPEVWRDRAGLSKKGADFVLMNPPFDREGGGSVSPDARRGTAYVAPPGLLESWCASAASLLNAGGMLGMIHRPAALPEIFEALVPRFGEIHIRPIHAHRSDDAGRILISARHGRRAPASILPGLVLHQSDGAWTPEADAILKGQAELTP